MAAPPKVTPEARKAILERKAAGLSNREIAAWLSATLGVDVSHVTVRATVLAATEKGEFPPKPAAGTTSPEDASTRPRRLRRAPKVAEAQDGAKAQDGEPVGGTDAIDLELLDDALGELDDDIDKARTAGNTQALATLMRLRADLIERRRKLRPPAPAAEDDAEAREAGAAAVAKLMKLVRAEIEKRGAA